jgi:serine protease Do
MGETMTVKFGLRMAKAIAGLALLAGLLLPTVADCGIAQAAFKAPDSVADLTEGLLESVVYVQTSQAAKGERQLPPMPQAPPGATPKAPDGSPFQEFFDDFFNKQQKGSQPPPMRVQSVGSGFVIDESGIVITNNHVVDGADDIQVVFADGTKLKAELVGRDVKVDLAVLKVKPSKPLKPLKFGDSDKIRIGDWALAIGNPFGIGETVTLGIISAKNRDIHSGPYDNFLQTDAAINKGNSGGPLFNMAGEVIGINTAIISPSATSAGIAFAIPSNTATAVISQLREFGETRRGWLGVQILDVTSDIAESLGMKDTKGVLVAGVTPKGPAESGGITTGDVITKFDGHDVPGVHDLPRMVADTSISKEVDVVVLRKGKEVSLKVTLGRLEDGEKLTDTKVSATAPAPDPTPLTKTLGLGLTVLDSTSRSKFKLTDKVTKGVVVADVDSGSAAADKRLAPGDVILEVGQEEVATPDEVLKRIEALKQDGRKRALLMISNANGEIRFVPLSIE